MLFFLFLLLSCSRSFIFFSKMPKVFSNKEDQLEKSLVNSFSSLKKCFSFPISKPSNFYLYSDSIEKINLSLGCTYAEESLHNKLLSGVLNNEPLENIVAIFKDAKQKNIKLKINEKIVFSDGADENYSYLLHAAILKSNCNIVECLIKKGADVKLLDSCQRDALLLAFDFSKIEIINYFLSLDQNWKKNFKKFGDSTCSDSSTYSMVLNFEIFQNFFNIEKIKDEKYIKDLIYYSILSGSDHVLQFIMDKEIDENILLNQINDLGFTLLHIAFATRNYRACSQILEKISVDERMKLIKKKDINGATCSHYLSFSKGLKKLSKEHGRLCLSLDMLIGFINWDLDEDDLLSPFFNLKEEIKGSFLELDFKGFSPLDYAAYFGDYSLCKSMLSIINSDEKYVLNYSNVMNAAYFSGEIQIVELFSKDEKIQKYKNEESKIEKFTLEALKFILINRKLELVKHFFSKQIDEKISRIIFNDKDILIAFYNLEGFDREIHNIIPLFYAREIEAINIIKRFSSEEINIQNSTNQTPLDKVIQEYLLENDKEKLDVTLNVIKELLLFENIEQNYKDGSFNYLLKSMLENSGKDSDKIFGLIDEIYHSKININYVDEENHNTILMNIVEFVGKNQNNTTTITMKFLKLILQNILSNQKYNFRHLNCRGSNLLHLLTEYNLTEEVLIFLEKLEYKIKDYFLFLEEPNLECFIALDIAVRNTNIEIIKKLLKFYGYENKIERAKAILMKMDENQPDLSKFLQKFISQDKISEKKVIMVNTDTEEASKAYSDDEDIVAFIDASSNGQVDVLKSLLEKGVDKEVADKTGWTGLMYASFNNQKDIVNILLAEGVDVNKQAQDNSTALMWAVENKNKDIVDLLLKKGALVDLADNDGFTPLIKACLREDTTDKDTEDAKIVKALLSGDQEQVSIIVNRFTKKGETALMFASKYNKRKIVSFLLEKGAEINAHDSQGCSALIYAIRDKKRKVVELLINNNNINLDLVDNNGYSPLMWACKGGDKYIISMLLRQKADRKIVGSDGETALTLAQSFCQKCVSDWLKETSYSTDEAFSAELCTRIEDIVKQDENEKTILHREVIRASKEGSINKLVDILRKVEDTVYLSELINKKDKNGQLAIHLAILDSTVLKILYSSGEYSSKQDSLGKTPLHYAAEKEKIESIEVINEFSSEEINIKDQKDQTPLEIAIKENKLDGVRSLLSFNSLKKGSKEEMFNSILKEDIKNKEIIELIYKHEINFDFIDKDNKNSILMNLIDLIGRNDKQSEEEKLEYKTNFNIFIKTVLKNELSKKYNFKHKNKEGQNILHLLTENNLEEETIIFLDKVKEFLPEAKEREDFLREKDLKQYKPLDYAQDKNNSKIFEKILELYTEKTRLEKYGKDNNFVKYTSNKALKMERKISNRDLQEITFEEQVDINDRGRKRDSDLDLSRRNSKDIGEYFPISEEKNEIKILECIHTLPRLPNNIEEREKKSIDITIDKGNEKSFEILMKNYLSRKNNEEIILTILITCLEKDREELVLKALKIKKIQEMFENAEEEMSKIFFALCYCGKTRVLEKLLIQEEFSKLDLLNKLDVNGCTLLYLASKKGQKELVEFLLTKGAAIDLADSYGWTPLIIAIHQGHKEVVKLLIENRAAIDLPDSHGWTPLMIASWEGKKEVVELLIKNDAAIDLRNKNAATALYLGSEKGHKEVVELLTENEVKIDLSNNDEWTPLMIASWEGHKEVVELLIEKGAAIDLRNKNAATALYLGSEKGHKEVVDLLIEKKAKIDLSNNNEWTALMIASMQGHKEVVELLIEKGAAIDLADKIGWTPLMIASWEGKKEVVELLLSKGAAVDLRNKDAATALYLCSEKGHKEVVELLIEKKAKIDLSNNNEWTALMIASQEGHKEVVKLLIEKRAAIDLQNKNGATPLYKASQWGHKEVVELLLAKGASIDLGMNDRSTPLMIASQWGHKEVVELLLAKGASIDLGMNDGRTPLMIASQEGHKEVVKMLLNKNASINSVNKNNSSALTLAVYYGHKEIVEMLIEKKASLDQQNNYGSTSLIASAIDIAKKKGYTEIVALLESALQKGKIREEV